MTQSRCCGDKDGFCQAPLLSPSYQGKGHPMSRHYGMSQSNEECCRYEANSCMLHRRGLLYSKSNLAGEKPIRDKKDKFLLYPLRIKYI